MTQVNGDRPAARAVEEWGPAGPVSFRVLPDRAAVVFVARSDAGPITFGATGIEGVIAATVLGGAVSVQAAPPLASLEVPVEHLTSGNQLYDAELLRRVDARRFPKARLELARVCPVGTTGRYHVAGALTFHGVTRAMEGTVTASLTPNRQLVVEGEQMLDMRHFDITPPAVAMLKIYPEVRVQLHLVARVEG